MRRLIATLVLTNIILTAHAESLPSPVEASLARIGVPPSAVALFVQEVGGAPPLVAHRLSEPMNPASVMKLVTTYAALDQLGPAFTWRTRILSSGQIHYATLRGDLFITGGGDPRLSVERLWLLLRDLRAQGVQRIAGDVVTDRSFFHLPPHDPDAFDQRPLRPYNVGADALSVDYGAIHLRVSPTASGATVSSETLPTGLVIDNRIRRSTGATCPDPTNTLIATRRETGASTRLTLEGSLPLGCVDAFDWHLAPLDPAQHFEGMFRALWKELGGEFDGHFREGSAPTNAQLLAESVSPPLPEVLRDMNKWSNNVIARDVLATLGALSEPGTDSPTAGTRVVQRSLTANGISTTGLVIENGAGLSRSERVSAATLGQLLQSAWRSRTMPELIASLPIAGMDGTARRRLAGTPAAGSAHVKTGTLDGVRTLAGYVLGSSGHRYVVVLMINHPNAGGARETQDALLSWVAGL